jgi:hypothetical protein
MLYNTCSLQVLDEELYRRLESPFLARFNLRVTHVAPDGEAVRAPGKVLADIARRVLAAAEELVRDLLLLGRELLVRLARVDEHGVVRVRLELLPRTSVPRSATHADHHEPQSPRAR